jgi:hypothetical protein
MVSDICPERFVRHLPGLHTYRPECLGLVEGLAVLIRQELFSGVLSSHFSGLRGERGVNRN